MKKILFFISVFVVFLLIISCNNQKKKEDEKELVKIGAILNLTGNLAIADDPKRKDIEIAVREINETGGLNGKELNVTFFDSRSQQNAVVSAYKDFLNKDLKVLLTGTSFTALPILPLSEKDNILHAGASADPIFTENKKLTIRCFPKATIGAKLMTGYFEKNKIKSIAIVHTNEPYGNAYAETVIDHFNGTIPIREKYKVGEQDFKNILTKIGNENVDYIVLIGFGISFPSFLKQILEYEIDIPIMANETFYKGEYDSEILNSSLFDNIVFLAPLFIEELKNSNTNNSFVKIHREVFEEDPQIFGVYVADFLKALQSLDKATNYQNPNEIIEKLRGKKDIKVYTGRIDIESTGDINYQLKLYKYEKNKLISLESL